MFAFGTRGRETFPLGSIHGRNELTHLCLSLITRRVRKLVFVSVKFFDTS